MELLFFIHGVQIALPQIYSDSDTAYTTMWVSQISEISSKLGKFRSKFQGPFQLGDKQEKVCQVET